MANEPWKQYQTETPTGPQPAPANNQPWTAYGGQPAPAPTELTHLNKEGTGFVNENLPKQEIPLKEVIPKAVENAYTQFIDSVKGAAKQVTDDPGKAAGKAGEGIKNIINATLGIAGAPITFPVWGLASGLQDLGMGRVGSEFREKYIQPTLDTVTGMQDKYGGWFGGEGNYGFTPEKGWERLKDTIANRPWEVGADVAPLVGGAYTKFIARPGRAFVADVAAAETRLKNMGIDTSSMTQQQIDNLRVRMNEIGWDEPKGKTDKGAPTTDLKERTAAAEEERRRIVFGDAKVDPTESMLTGSDAARLREDRIRNGTEGSRAAEIMNDSDTKRIAQTNERTDQLRSQLSGSPDRMEPAVIGDTITQRYNAADSAAKDVVTDKYTRAFDPTELANANVASHVPEADVKGLTTAVRDRFTDPKHPFVATESTAPNTVQAIKAVEDFSKTGRLPVIGGDPMPPPGTSGVSWQSADAMRKYLVGLRESARANPVDAAAMSRVIDAFDAQLGKSNSLLNDARTAHSERMQTFHPQVHQAGDDVVKAAEALTKSQNNGITQFNKLFEGGFNSGQQIDAINHLKTVFANDPAAMMALREGALEKIFVNKKNYDNLSPQKTATALDTALNGPQGAIYKTLFDKDELALLRQHQELTDIVGKHTRPSNPPRSGHEVNIEKRKEAAQERAKQAIEGLITAAGSGLGLLTGDATTAVGAGAGSYGAGRVAGSLFGPMGGSLIQKLLSDPAGVRAAGRMSMPPPAKAPQMSIAPAGVLTGAGEVTTPEPSRKARGGALRRLGG